MFGTFSFHLMKDLLLSVPLSRFWKRTLSIFIAFYEGFQDSQNDCRWSNLPILPPGSNSIYPLVSYVDPNWYVYFWQSWIYMYRFLFRVSSGMLQAEVYVDDVPILLLVQSKLKSVFCLFEDKLNCYVFLYFFLRYF